MIDFKNIKIDNKDVQFLYIDGNKAYTLLEDKSPAINNEAKTILDNATFVKDDVYGDISFKVWDTFQHQFCQVGVGNVHCWYLTPHIMVSANHYPNKPVGDYTLNNGTVVKKLQWVNLHQWAEQHGGIEKYKYLNFSGDIDFITLDKSTSIPDEYLPWMMSLNTMRKYFTRDTFDGVVGFKTSQKHQYGVPIVFDTLCDWHSIYQNEKCPEELKTRVEEMGQTTPSYEGDSGRPIYIVIDGKPVVVSQYRSTVQGPNFVYCFDMIRDFAKEYEGEDLIKQIT